MRGMRLVGLVALAALSSGCFELDPFLYKRERVSEYLLPAEGPTPEETVAPEQLEPVRLQVDDTVSLGAVYIRPSTGTARGYVLYFHGQGGQLDSHFRRGKVLANLGYGVLVFDYRGWGTSTNVTPTEAGILEDSKAAVAWLTARTGLPAGRLVYYGRSFGSATATQMAVEAPPAALILESPYASIQAMVRDSSNMDLPVGYVAQDTWDTEGRLRGLTGVPLLLLHGTADDFVRPEFSEQLYAAAHEPKQLVLVEGATHSDVTERMGAEYGTTLASFLETTAAGP